MRDLLLVNALVKKITTLHNVHQSKDNTDTPGDRLVTYYHIRVNKGTEVFVWCLESLGPTVSGSVVSLHHKGYLEVFFVPDEAVDTENVGAVRRLVGKEEEEAKDRYLQSLHKHTLLGRELASQRGE